MMGFLEAKNFFHIWEFCRLQDCDPNFPQVFDFLCSLDPNKLLSIKEDRLVTRFSDFPKLSNYIKAGFKYLPDIGGILFLKDRKKISVLDFALETFGEAKIGKLLRDLLSPKA